MYYVKDHIRLSYLDYPQIKAIGKYDLMPSGLNIVLVLVVIGLFSILLVLAVQYHKRPYIQRRSCQKDYQSLCRKGQTGGNEACRLSI